MTDVVGEAFVAIRPDFGGFGTSLEAQLQKVLSSADKVVGDALKPIQKTASDAGANAGQKLAESLESKTDKTGQKIGDKIGTDVGEAIKTRVNGIDISNIGKDFGGGFADEFERSFSARNIASTIGQKLKAPFAKEGGGAGREFIEHFQTEFGKLKPIKIPILGLAVGDVVSSGITHLITLVGQLGGGAIAMGSQVGLAASSIVALGAAAGASAGLLATLPTVFVAYGLVAGTAALASAGLSQAIRDLASGSKNATKELAALPPAARAFAIEVASLKPKLDDLRQTAAAGLFPGVTAGLKSVLVLFPDVKAAVASTAKTMGDLAEAAGKLVAGPLKSEFQTVIKTASEIVQILSGSVLGLGTTFVNVAATAAPFAKLLAEDVTSGLKSATAAVNTFTGEGGLVDFLDTAYTSFSLLGSIAKNVGETLGRVLASAIKPGQLLLTVIEENTNALLAVTKTAQQDGSLTAFFSRSVDAARTLGSIIGNVVISIVNIGHAAAPAGKILIDQLDQATEKFRAFTGSAEGQAKLQKFFLDLIPTIDAVGHLVTDVVKAFAFFSTIPGNKELVDQIRVQLLPAIERLFVTLSNSGVLSKFIDLLTNGVDAMTKLAAAGKGTNAILETLNGLLTIVNKVISLPGAGELITVVTTFAGINAALKLSLRLLGGVVSNIPGLGKAAELAGKTAQKAAGTETTGAALSKGGKSFASGAAKIATRIGPAIVAAIGAIDVGAILAAIGTALATVASTIAAVIFSPAVLIGAAIAAVAFLAFHFRKGIIDFFANTLPDAVGAAVGAGGRLASTIGGALSSAFDSAFAFVTKTVPDKLGEIGNAIAGFASVLAAKGVVLITGLLNGIVTGFVAVQKFFDELPNKILYAFAFVTTYLVIKGAELIAGFVVGMVTAYVDVAKFFIALPGEIIGFVGDVSKTIYSKGTDLIEGAYNGIKDATVAVQAFFVALPGVVFGWIGNVAKTIYSKGTDLIGGAYSGIKDATVAVQNFFQALPGVVFGWIGDVAKTIYSKGSDIIGGFARGVTDATVAVQSFFRALPGNIVGFVGDVGGLLTAKGHDVINGFTSGVGAVYDTAIAKFRNLRTDIINAVPGAASFLIEAGKDVIKGLLGGINSLYDSVIGRMKSLGGSIIQGFKDAVKSASPSKKMLAEGVNLIQGLVNGIDGMQPAVEKSIAKIAATALDLGNIGVGITASLPDIAASPNVAASAGAAAAARSGNEINYNLSLQTATVASDVATQFGWMELAGLGGATP